MAQDKKVKGGALTFILARGIGRSFIAPGVEVDEVRAFLRKREQRVTVMIEESSVDLWLAALIVIFCLRALGLLLGRRDGLHAAHRAPACSSSRRAATGAPGS